MRKEIKDFYDYIESLCISYLRKDKINKIDTEDDFINDLYLTMPIGRIEPFCLFSWYEEEFDDGQEKRSTFSVGSINFKKFKLKLIVDIYSHYSSRNIYISKPYEHTQNKFNVKMDSCEGYEIPEKFDPIFQ